MPILMLLILSQIYISFTPAILQYIYMDTQTQTHTQNASTRNSIDAHAQEKVLCAMSGGVDSSVAAKLLVDAHYTVVGATMHLFDNETAFGVESLANESTGENMGKSADTSASASKQRNAQAATHKTCCSLSDVEDAKRVCWQLGLEHYTFNYKDLFEKTVIQPFCDAYLNNETPNPCIACNRYLKFDALQKRRREMNFDYVATGHYARRVFDEATQTYLLKKGLDENKDQSYVLFHLTQDQLSHMLFPLGNFTKQEIRELAHASNFSNADKQESQDICFIPDGNYAAFIKRFTGKTFESGPILDTQGNVLGTHNGLASYTYGQRQGLGIAYSEPLYVLQKDANANALIVGTKAQLGVQTVYAQDVNFISGAPIKSNTQVTAKTHYRQRENKGSAYMNGNTLVVHFDEKVGMCAPGQFLVIYDGDTVLGGGTICGFE